MHRISDMRWFQTLDGLLVISAVVLGTGLHRSLRNVRLDKQIVGETRLAHVGRRNLICAALTIARYMYLIPQ